MSQLLGRQAFGEGLVETKLASRRERVLRERTVIVRGGDYGSPRGSGLGIRFFVSYEVDKTTFVAADSVDRMVVSRLMKILRTYGDTVAHAITAMHGTL